LLALGEARMPNDDWCSCHPAFGAVTSGANQLGKGALLFRIIKSSRPFLNDAVCTVQVTSSCDTINMNDKMFEL
jgi:hypothetical protein